MINPAALGTASIAGKGLTNAGSSAGDSPSKATNQFATSLANLATAIQLADVSEGILGTNTPVPDVPNMKGANKEPEIPSF